MPRGVALELEGKQFGYLSVIKREGSYSKSGASRWLCQCKCGNVIVTSGRRINNGTTKSCGCYCIQRTKEKNLKLVGEVSFSETEIAWLAGMIEGEGSFSIPADGKGSASINFGSTDKDISDRIAVMFQSKVHTRERKERKTFYSTKVSQRARVKIILEKIYPYMGIRRRSQIDKVREFFSSRDDIAAMVVRYRERTNTAQSQTEFFTAQQYYEKFRKPRK